MPEPSHLLILWLVENIWKGGRRLQKNTKDDWMKVLPVSFKTEIRFLHYDWSQLVTARGLLVDARCDILMCVTTPHWAAGCFAKLYPKPLAPLFAHSSSRKYCSNLIKLMPLQRCHCLQARGNFLFSSQLKLGCNWGVLSAWRMRIYADIKI